MKSEPSTADGSNVHPLTHPHPPTLPRTPLVPRTTSPPLSPRSIRRRRHRHPLPFPQIQNHGDGRADRKAMVADLMDPSPSPPQPPRTHARHPQPSPSLCDLDRPCSPPPASTSPEIEASPPSNHGFLARQRARRSINLAGSGVRVACLGSLATRTGQRHRLPRLRRLRPDLPLAAGVSPR